LQFLTHNARASAGTRCLIVAVCGPSPCSFPTFFSIPSFLLTPTLHKQHHIMQTSMPQRLSCRPAFPLCIFQRSKQTLRVVVKASHCLKLELRTDANDRDDDSSHRHIFVPARACAPALSQLRILYSTDYPYCSRLCCARATCLE